MNKLLEQIDAASEIAREAFAAGDKTTGVKAILLAAQLVQIAKLLSPNSERESECAGLKESERTAEGNLSH